MAKHIFRGKVYGETNNEWIGTKAEYELVKDTIPVGYKVIITDDDDVSLDLIELDKTLTNEGKAAESKATGEALNQLKIDLSNDISKILTVEEGQVENLLDKAVGFFTGFNNNDYDVTLPDGTVEKAGAYFLDYQTALIPIEPGKTYYTNFLKNSITLPLYDSNLNYFKSFSQNGEYFTIPEETKAAYLGITCRRGSLLSSIISEEPISKDSGDLDRGKVFMRYVREAEEVYITSDEKEKVITFPKSLIPIYTDQIQDVVYGNVYIPSLYSYTAPDGTIEKSKWLAYYMKQGNCNYSGGVPNNQYRAEEYYPNANPPHYSFPFVNDLDNWQLGQINDNLYRYKERIYPGLNILAMTNDGQFLCLDPHTNSTSNDITYGLLLFRNPLKQAYTRAFADGSNSSSVHLTNYGTYNNQNNIADLQYKLMEKRIVGDYIIFKFKGDTNPIWKFKISEIKSLIDNYDYENNPLTWSAYTQEEIDTWENGEKDLVYHSYQFDFNVTGILIFEGIKAYAGQEIMAFSSISPIHKLGYDKIDILSGESNQWKNKKWWAYGTSMTINSGCYTPQLAEMAGLELHNYGLGGSGIIPSLHSSDCTKTRCMRLTDGKADADLITIEVIPNDMNGTLGTSTDTSDSTFCGNLNQILQYLQENTNAQIVVLIATPSRYNYQDTSIKYPPTSENKGLWIEWINATIEVCRRNCVQCWDGFSNCGLGYYRVSGNNNYVSDQIHLTELGGYNLAKYYYSQLKNLPLFYTSK